MNVFIGSVYFSIYKNLSLPKTYSSWSLKPICLHVFYYPVYHTYIIVFYVHFYITRGYSSTSTVIITIFKRGQSAMIFVLEHLLNCRAFHEKEQGSSHLKKKLWSSTSTNCHTVEVFLHGTNSSLLRIR